jgi:hypothetical protein
VYSDTEHVSGMVLSVMFQNVPRNMCIKCLVVNTIRAGESHFGNTSMV